MLRRLWSALKWLRTRMTPASNVCGCCYWPKYADEPCKLGCRASADGRDCVIHGGDL